MGCNFVAVVLNISVFDPSSPFPNVLDSHLYRRVICIYDYSGWVNVMVAFFIPTKQHNADLNTICNISTIWSYLCLIRILNLTYGRYY